MLGENMRQCSLEYLLGDRDSSQRHRPSELIDGNLPALLEARKIASKYKRPQIAFSYRDKKLSFEQIGGHEFEEKLKEDILNTFLPGLDRSQFHYAFIRHHNDDGGYELNFYMLQMTQNRQFTAYWHDKDVNLHRLLSRKIHQENPHLTNPWKQEYEQLIYPAKKAFNADSKIVKDVQETLDNALKQQLIKSRNDFLELLKKQGYEISRSPQETFTVVAEKKRIRFAGAAARADFDSQNILRTPKIDNTDYTALWKEACLRKHNQLIQKYKFIKPYEQESNRINRQTTGAVSLQNAAENSGTERAVRASKNETSNRREVGGSERSIDRIKGNIEFCQNAIDAIANESDESAERIIGSYIRKNFTKVALRIVTGIGSLLGRMVQSAFGGIFQKIGGMPENYSDGQSNVNNQNNDDHGYFDR
jgi:hypothetical protein